MVPSRQSRSRTRIYILRFVAETVGSNSFINPIRAGKSCDVLDVHGYYTDYNTPGDSAEYFFDASANEYLAFADDVIALAQSHVAIGYMGIRFTTRASALPAMQRYELTASVEIATLRSRTEPVYPEFWSSLHASASRYGGVPHWGQEFVPSGESVKACYGEDLRLWRQVLAALSAEDVGTFSTPLTRSLGLEPDGDVLVYDALRAFLSAIDGAED